MDKWTSYQYDDSFHLVGITIVEGGFNAKQQVTRRSHEYEREHRGCAAIEVKGGPENCPVTMNAEIVEKLHMIRGK
ncbi:MAG: hypothetical protein MUF72_04950 [Elainella sp. Prado103]|nr:hypothetical protein [Elainella sp. Prado103]